MTAHAAQLGSILRGDPHRWRLLEIVQDLGLPDCWIAAGFVRNAVWDRLHRRPPAPCSTDVDVIWFDRRGADAEEDRRLEARLAARDTSVRWSVKNQARMHARNGDAAYASATEAMRFWPETATAVAARRIGTDECEIAAPCGLDDLMNLILRPTPRFRAEKRAIYEERIMSKGWMRVWPLLKRADE